MSGRKVPASYNSKTTKDIEMKFGWLVNNHKTILSSVPFKCNMTPH